MTAQNYDDPHHVASAPVVVGVDGTPNSDIAVRWAAEYAQRRGRALRLLHGLDLVGMSGVLGAYEVAIPPVIDAVREHGHKVVTHAKEIAHEIGPDLRVSIAMSPETAAALLIEESEKAYVTVLGATGDIGTLAHLGSTLLAVTAHGHGTVAVVRPDMDEDNIIRDTGPVVVGVDGSPVSEAAIGVAFAEASARRSELVAVHTWSDRDFGKFAGSAMVPDEELEKAEWAILGERLAGWQEKYPDVTVIRKVYPSAPAAQLRVWSKQAQLVVVGSRGRGGFRGLLFGSTANSLVQHAHCPVMVVHPAD